MGRMLRAAGVDQGIVVGVEGLRDEDLVAVVQDAVHGDLQRLAAAGGDEDITGIASAYARSRDSSLRIASISSGIPGDGA